MIKNNTISIYCKNFIDILKTNKIVGTSYNKTEKIFSIYLDDYQFSYLISDFNDERDFINTINNVNRVIRGYEEGEYV